MLAINQHGERMYLPGVHPRKELLKALTATHAQKMYIDSMKGGQSHHVGYVVRGGWWTLYNEWGF